MGVTILRLLLIISQIYLNHPEHISFKKQEHFQSVLQQKIGKEQDLFRQSQYYQDLFQSLLIVGKQKQYQSLKKSAGFVTAFKGYGPFNLPVGAVYDATIKKLKSIKTVMNGGIFDHLDYRIAPPLKEKGLYLIERTCYLPTKGRITLGMRGSFQLLINDQIIFDQKPKGGVAAIYRRDFTLSAPGKYQLTLKGRFDLSRFQSLQITGGCDKIEVTEAHPKLTLGVVNRFPYRGDYHLEQEEGDQLETYDMLLKKLKRHETPAIFEQIIEYTYQRGLYHRMLKHLKSYLYFKPIIKNSILLEIIRKYNPDYMRYLEVWNVDLKQRDLLDPYFTKIKPVTKKIMDNRILLKEIIADFNQGDLYHHYHIYIKDPNQFLDHFQLDASVDIILLKRYRNGQESVLPVTLLGTHYLIEGIQSGDQLNIIYREVLDPEQQYFFPQEYVMGIDQYRFRALGLVPQVVNTAYYKKNKDQIILSDLSPYKPEEHMPNPEHFMPHIVIDHKPPQKLIDQYQVKYRLIPKGEDRGTPQTLFHRFKKRGLIGAAQFALVLKGRGIPYKMMSLQGENSDQHYSVVNWWIDHINYYGDFYRKQITTKAPGDIEYHYQIIDHNGITHKGKKSILGYREPNHLYLKLKLLKDLESLSGEGILRLSRSHIAQFKKRYSAVTQALWGDYLELFLIEQMGDVTLIDYEVSQKQKRVTIFFSFSMAAPINLFEEDGELLQLKGVMPQLWSALFLGMKPLQLADQKKRYYPIKIPSFIEQQTIELILEDRDYRFLKEIPGTLFQRRGEGIGIDFFIQGTPTRILLQQNILFERGILSPKQYGIFYEIVKQFYHQRYLMEQSLFLKARQK